MFETPASRRFTHQTTRLLSKKNGPMDQHEQHFESRTYSLHVQSTVFTHLRPTAPHRRRAEDLHRRPAKAPGGPRSLQRERGPPRGRSMMKDASEHPCGLVSEEFDKQELSQLLSCGLNEFAASKIRT